MSRPLRIAVAGLGTVGGGVVRVLSEREDDLAERAGRELVPAVVCARDRRKRRADWIAAIPWADDPLALAQSDVDVVVELIGGESGVAEQVAAPVRGVLAGILEIHREGRLAGK